LKKIRKVLQDSRKENEAGSISEMQDRIYKEISRKPGIRAITSEDRNRGGRGS